MNKKFIEGNIFKNCLSIKQTKEGILPLRFTEAQLNEYSKTEGSRIRSRSLAGICIDMLTDSSYVQIDYSIKGSARNWMYFDIYLNNIFVDSIGNSNIQEGLDKFYYEIPQNGQKLNRVTIYLPHLVEIIIHDIKLSENAQINEIKPFKKNLLCLGDSITQGMEAKYPSCSYPVKMAQFLDMNLLNQGVGGDVFNEKHLDPLLPFKPDIITVAYGTNDWFSCKKPSEFVNNCSRYIKKLTEVYKTANIFIITPFWRKDLYDKKESGTFFDICGNIINICKQYPQLTLIDGMELMPHKTEYFGDGKLHPSDEGFLHITLNILKKLHTKYREKNI